jgi:hypothetical protein
MLLLLLFLVGMLQGRSGWTGKLYLPMSMTVLMTVLTRCQ